jgi:hypothetical protein
VPQRLHRSSMFRSQKKIADLSASDSLPRTRS